MRNKSVQCCCGKYRVFDAGLQLNDYIHEPLGPKGNFCGGVIQHDLRDAKRERDAAIQRSENVDAARAQLAAALLVARSYLDEFEFEISSKIVDDALSANDLAAGQLWKALLMEHKAVMAWAHSPSVEAAKLADPMPKVEKDLVDCGCVVEAALVFVV